MRGGRCVLCRSHGCYGQACVARAARRAAMEATPFDFWATLVPTHGVGGLRTRWHEATPAAFKGVGARKLHVDRNVTHRKIAAWRHQ